MEICDESCLTNGLSRHEHEADGTCSENLLSGQTSQVPFSHRPPIGLLAEPFVLPQPLHTEGVFTEFRVWALFLWTAHPDTRRKIYTEAGSMWKSTVLKPSVLNFGVSGGQMKNEDVPHKRLRMSLNQMLLLWICWWLHILMLLTAETLPYLRLTWS